MTELIPDRDLARNCSGLLAQFNRAGVLTAADVHVARRLGAITEEPREPVLLAVALAVRAARLGSVCVYLPGVGDSLAEAEADVPVPELTSWLSEIAASPLVERGVIRLVGSLLYLDRYWREEQQVCHDLMDRIDRRMTSLDEARLGAALQRILGGETFTDQRDIVDAAARRVLTVLTGGPGTGKTTTVARLLAVIAEQFELAHGRRPRVALCAPTAKAAGRLSDAVAEQLAQLEPSDRDRLGELTATTIHRLLGVLPGLVRTRFRHNRQRRLPHDIVVVDETSMVSLTQMARLLEAVRADAQLVLVGDADQLASIDVGAVLGDIVTGLADHPEAPVARLTRVHRFSGAIGDLADALRSADADAVLEVIMSGGSSVTLIDPTDSAAVEQVLGEVVDRAVSMTAAAECGDATAALAELDAHRLLCAHRDGPYGVRGWNRRVEAELSERTGISTFAPWYPGRPVLVTANNRTLGIWNGDSGVAVRGSDQRLEVAVATPQGSRRLATTRLPDTETLFAMTVHKAQGSQADSVTVVVPPAESALLTRELFYTAVTRARTSLRVIGTPDDIRAAIERRALRASGLADLLASRYADPAN